MCKGVKDFGKINDIVFEKQQHFFINLIAKDD